jgi:hypothetical protein
MEVNAMRRKLTMLFLSILVGVGGSVAVASPASAEWRAIQAYRRGADCEIAGRYYVNHVVGALWYTCDWDSPSWMLWVFFDEA